MLRVGGAILWATLAGVVGAAMADLEPNLVDEGLQLHFAERLADGEHLYRDAVFFVGPFSFELLALLFRVFGSHVVVARVTVVVLHAIATGVGFAVARRAAGSSTAHVFAAVMTSAPALLFPFFTMYFYTVLAAHLGLLAVYAATRGLRSPAWALACGVLVAAVTLCKQSLGVFLASGLLIGLLALAPRAGALRRTGAWIAGGAGVTAAVVLGWAARGDLAHAFRFLVIVPFSLRASFHATYMNLWPPGILAEEIRSSAMIYLPRSLFLEHDIWTQIGVAEVLAAQLSYALPLAAVAATAFLGLRYPLPTGVWLHGALALALATNPFPRASWGHLAYALPSAVNQLVLLGGVFVGPRISPSARRATAGIACVALLGAAGLEGTRLREFSVRSAWGPRVPLRPVSAALRGPTYPRFIRYLRAHTEPGEPIFVARSEPLLYFATETKNPTPYGGVLHALHDEQQQRVIEALDGVRFVVMSDIDQPLWTFYAEELPRIQRHLERHFHLASGLPQAPAEPLILLERGDDRGATAIDLLDEQADAYRWLRDSEGEVSRFAGEPPRLAARHNRRPLSVPLGRGGGGIDFDITPPRGAVFQADLGFPVMFSLRGFHRHPSGVRARLSVLDAGREEGLFEREFRRVDPWRGWVPVEVDLSGYGGRAITLRLEFVAERPLESDQLGWWGSPRVALPPRSGSRPALVDDLARASGGPD